jgi:hypothetical protein
MAAMRMALRDLRRRRVGRIDVDPAARPTRVRVPGSERDVFLSWDVALDDAGQLRRCVACGCTDLFREKNFPQITPFVVALAFAGAVIGALDLATTPMLAAMALVLVADVAILVFSRRRLVCYRCRTSYHELPIARYHRTWDRATAERHPATTEEGPAGASPAMPSPPPFRSERAEWARTSP